MTDQFLFVYRNSPFLPPTLNRIRAIVVTPTNVTGALSPSGETFEVTDERGVQTFAVQESHAIHATEHTAWNDLDPENDGVNAFQQALALFHPELPRRFAIYPLL